MILIDYLASHVLAFVLSAAVLGLLVGSFLNVVIYRVPIMMQREWRMQAREYLDYPPGAIWGAFQSTGAEFTLPSLRSSYPCLGEHSLGQLAGAAWKVLVLSDADQLSISVG